MPRETLCTNQLVLLNCDNAGDWVSLKMMQKYVVETAKMMHFLIFEYQEKMHVLAGKQN
jgi:hypothetical protein